MAIKVTYRRTRRLSMRIVKNGAQSNQSEVFADLAFLANSNSDRGRWQ